MPTSIFPILQHEVRYALPIFLQPSRALLAERLSFHILCNTYDIFRNKPFNLAANELIKILLLENRKM